MKSRDAVNLTKIMREFRILRIARFDFNGREYFNVAMEGDILGTGEDAEEAFQNAASQRDVRAAQMEEAA